MPIVKYPIKDRIEILATLVTIEDPPEILAYDLIFELYLIYHHACSNQEVSPRFSGDASSFLENLKKLFPFHG